MRDDTLYIHPRLDSYISRGNGAHVKGSAVCDNHWRFLGDEDSSAATSAICEVTGGAGTSFVTSFCFGTLWFCLLPKGVWKVLQSISY